MRIRAIWDSGPCGWYGRAEEWDKGPDVFEADEALFAEYGRAQRALSDAEDKLEEALRRYRNAVKAS